MSERPNEPAPAWPRLTLGEWSETYAAVHLWTQMVGKTRLAHAAAQNHWWHVTLYVTARGLGTSAIPYGARTYEIEFDFLDHRLVVRTSDGDVRSMPLSGRPIADFYRDYLALLRSADIQARIWPRPMESAGVIPFPADRGHAAYDPDAARRCWRILAQVDRVLKEFRGRFLGKCSPVHFWWGSFDIACTRFSGRPAPPHPGGIPNLSDAVTRESYSHECISAGWWPGSLGTPVEEPSFYAYAYPEPPGCPEAVVRPAEARYHPVLREWVLSYEAVRTAADPDASLLAFLESTYEAASELAGWDRATLERPSAVEAEARASSV